MDDPRFATAAGRLAAVDELEERLSRWTAAQDKRAVADRLVASVDRGVLVSRLAADGFGLLFPDEVGDWLVEGIQEDLRGAFVVGGDEVHLTASIGFTSGCTKNVHTLPIAQARPNAIGNATAMPETDVAPSSSMLARLKTTPPPKAHAILRTPASRKLS